MRYVETTNNDGKVLAYDGDKIVGQLDFTFKSNERLHRTQRL